MCSGSHLICPSMQRRAAAPAEANLVEVPWFAKHHSASFPFPLLDSTPHSSLHYSPSLLFLSLHFTQLHPTPLPSSSPPSLPPILSSPPLPSPPPLHYSHSFNSMTLPDPLPLHPLSHSIPLHSPAPLHSSDVNTTECVPCTR